MRLLLLTFSISITSLLFSQAPGSTCARAVTFSLPTVVGNTTSTGTQTTCGTGNDYAAGSYCTSSLYGDGEDGVYSITVPASGGNYTFSLGGSSTYKILSIHTSCPPSTSNCVTGATTSFGTTASRSVKLTAGTYYVLVDTYPAPTCGEFSISATLNSIPPVNDECANATTITPGTPIVASTFGADQDYTWTGQPCTNTGEVWYKFTTPATASCYSFAYDQVTNGCNTVSIWEAACPTGAYTDYQANHSTNNYNDQGSNESELAGMLPNTTYYISVSNDIDANFTFNIRPNTPLATNDQCSGANGIGTAPQLADNAVAGCEYSYVSGQDGGLQSTNPSSCDKANDFPCSPSDGYGPLAICALTLENISWYKFTAAATGTVTITFSNIECNNGGGGFQSGLFTGTNCSSLTATGACIAASSGTATYTISATAGSSYFIAMDGNAGSNCHYLVSGTNVVPLPIELGNFTATLNDNNGVTLNWNTLTERNNDYFEILRSKDGYTFELLGKVYGAGNSTSEKFYSLKDNSPFEGTSYYKLIQVDYDGNKTESSFAEVVIEKSNELDMNIYPNPTYSNNAKLNIKNQTKRVNIQITDAMGKIVNTSTIETISFHTEIEMKHNFKKGIYFVTLHNDLGEKTTSKWIIE